MSVMISCPLLPRSCLTHLVHYVHASEQKQQQQQQHEQQHGGHNIISYFIIIKFWYYFSYYSQPSVNQVVRGDDYRHFSNSSRWKRWYGISG